MSDHTKDKEVYSLHCESISSFMREVRKGQGYSQDEIAIILGISQSRISEIENNKRLVSLFEFNLFCIHILGLSIVNSVMTAYSCAQGVHTVDRIEPGSKF